MLELGGRAVGKDILNSPSTGILMVKTEHLWQRRVGCSSDSPAVRRLGGGRRQAVGVRDGSLNYPNRLSIAKTLERLSGAWEESLPGLTSRQ